MKTVCLINDSKLGSQFLINVSWNIDNDLTLLLVKYLVLLLNHFY